MHVIAMSFHRLGVSQKRSSHFARPDFPTNIIRERVLLRQGCHFSHRYLRHTRASAPNHEFASRCDTSMLSSGNLYQDFHTNRVQGASLCNHHR